MTTCAVPLRDKKALREATGPIRMTITFVPPDRRHRDDDNMIASLKSARDGIADALGVNDRRFRPNYVFAEPEKPGRVEVEIIHTNAADKSPDSGTNRADSAMEKASREGASNTAPGSDQLAEVERTAMNPDTARSPSAQPIKGGA